MVHAGDRCDKVPSREAGRQPGKRPPLFYDTVWDVMRLIDYLSTRDDVDPARIGLFGLSKGGIETYLTAAVDPRVAVAVPCLAVQGFEWELEHHAWQSRAGTFWDAFKGAAKNESKRVTLPSNCWDGRSRPITIQPVTRSTGRNGSGSTADQRRRSIIISACWDAAACWCSMSSPRWINSAGFSQRLRPSSSAARGMNVVRIHQI